jgi:hypothetical protein
MGPAARASGTQPPQLQTPATPQPLHHPPPAPVGQRVAQLATTADRGAHIPPTDEQGFAVGVVHQHGVTGRIPADHLAPVAAAAGFDHRPLVKPAHRDRDAYAQLGQQLQRLELRAS